LFGAGQATSLLSSKKGDQMNNRRKLVIALGAAALGSPLTPYAQTKVWRIGFLGPNSTNAYAKEVEALRAGLREFGYVEGKNLHVEFRWAGGDYTQLPTLAAELAALKVDLIVAATTPVSRAVQQATATIPVVMINIGDPVGAGLVKTLARPGGNITGLSNLTGDTNDKRLEMILSIAPKSSSVSYLLNPDNPQNALSSKNLQATGQKHGIKLLAAEVRTLQDFDKAFAAMHQQNVGAVIVALDGFLQQHRNKIVELTTKYRLPSITSDSMYADAGGLIVYGTNLPEHFRYAASFVDKIFKGAKPADLPVEQPTKLELIINGKTAKTLGLKIPQSLLISANKIIE
jgi:putative ABC transport system substrate-binding protein